MANRVSVTINVENPGDTARIAGVLRERGFNVDDVLEEIGTINAQCNDDRVQELSAVPGVRRVERQRTVKIPPPDSKVQ